MSQVGWGAGLVVGALACMICAAGRIGFFEGQVMLTAGVILLWMRLQGGDSDTKHDEAATFAAPTSNRGGARIFAMLALGLAFVVALAAVWAVRDASLRWLVWGVLAFATGAGVAVAAGGPRGGPHAAARAGVHLCAYALLLGVGARLTLPPVLGAIHAARGAREVGESALFGAAEVLAFTPQTPGFAAMTPEAVLLLLLPALGVVPERAGRFGAILALGAAIALLATRLFLTR
ncbi:MAG: hypothetical protein EA379_10420 [Phycisphaerales bacterium]|nr:MAG: hypothetical protein EA379_10420 [Phycisphaerales bacterium]